MKKHTTGYFILAVAIFCVGCSSTPSGLKNSTPSPTSPQSKFPASHWMKLETKVKLEGIKRVIALAKEDKIIIRFLPEYYVKEIDSTIENAIKNHDEKGLSTSVGVMLHTIAAMDGDWDNGENRLEHVKKWLGPTHFEFFKQAFPKKYAALLRERKEVEEVWKLLGESGNNVVYYDSQSINYASRSVVKIWSKAVPKDRKAELENLKRRGLYKADYAYMLTLYTIDCVNSGFAIRAAYNYDMAGELIDAHDFPEAWNSIPLNSVINHLSEIGCSELKGKDLT